MNMVLNKSRIILISVLLILAIIVIVTSHIFGQPITFSSEVDLGNIIAAEVTWLGNDLTYSKPYFSSILFLV